LIGNIIKPFYLEGLSFECCRCSTCCRHTPGYVFISLNDLELLASHTGMDKKEILTKYCREIYTIRGTKISLKEKPNYDCIFWEKDGCIYYEARPIQCRSYPFWKAYLGNRRKWESLRSFCPGIDKGKKHSKEEIEEWLDKVRQENYYFI